MTIGGTLDRARRINRWKESTMHTTAKGSTRRKLYIYSYTVNLRGSHSRDWPCEAVHAIALGQARPRFAAINVTYVYIVIMLRLRLTTYSTFMYDDCVRMKCSPRKTVGVSTPRVASNRKKFEDERMFHFFFSE